MQFPELLGALVGKTKWEERLGIVGEIEGGAKDFSKNRQTGHGGNACEGQPRVTGI